MGLLNKIEKKGKPVRNKANPEKKIPTVPKKVEKAAEKDKPKNIVKKELPAEKKPAQSSKGSIETDMDRINSIIIKHKNMSLKDIATVLNTDVKRVEDLSRILNKYKIAELYYPTAGSPVLRQILPEEKGKLKAHKGFNLIIFGGILLIIAGILIVVLKYTGFIL
jgi:hypothetical protein